MEGEEFRVWNSTCEGLVLRGCSGGQKKKKKKPSAQLLSLCISLYPEPSVTGLAGTLAGGWAAGGLTSLDRRTPKNG